MARLAYTISNQSLTVFVQGRPRSLTKDAPTFDEVRALLVAPGDHDTALILDLVDVRSALMRKSFGAIQVDGNEIIWRGRPISNLWVDRILDHRTRGEDFSALWAALDRLMHNPTQTAIDRLPIFLDRVGLPFMPDGRFLAFKGVTANYESAHVSPDGTRFSHQVGDCPRMPREQVDADPNETCSTGLHVGAPGYVRGHYSGGSYALVLVAVDPVDVVAVPTDYDGEKMRVCGYEVIEHLSQDYSDEVFGRLRRDYIDRKPDPAPTGAELAALACVGDVVTYAGHPSDGHSGAVAAGIYEVLEVDDSDDMDEGKRLRVATAWEQVWLRDAGITKVERDGLEITSAADIEPEPEDDEDEDEDLDETSEYDTVKLGDVVEWTDRAATIFSVVSITNEGAGFSVLNPEGEIEFVADHEFVRVVSSSEVTASMLVTAGCEVLVRGHSFLKEATYVVAGFEEENGDGTQADLDDKVWDVLVEGTRISVPNSVIVKVTHEGEQLWPRTDVKVEGDTVTLTSLDGHDLRGEAEALIVPQARAEVGDRVEIRDGGWPPAGVYPVVEVYAAGVIVQTEHDGIVSVLEDAVVSIERRPWMRAEVGGYVTLSYGDQQSNGQYSAVGSGRWEVTDLQLRGDNPQIQVRMPPLGNWWIDATRVTSVEPKA